MLEKATISIYLPLIDTKLSDPSTMMTAAIKAMEFSGHSEGSGLVKHTH